MSKHLTTTEYYEAAGVVTTYWEFFNQSNVSAREFLTTLLDTPAHLFFTPKTVEQFLDTVMSNPALLEIVLSASASFAVYMTTAREDGLAVLIDTITTGISCAFAAHDDHRNSYTISVLPDQVRGHIVHDLEELRSMLHANFWLVTLWMTRVGYEISTREA